MDLQDLTPPAPARVYSPLAVPVQEFVDGIRNLAGGTITKPKLYEYLTTFEIRVRISSLITSGCRTGTPGTRSSATRGSK